MTKSELIHCLAEQHPQFALKDIDTIVDEILDAIRNALVRGQRVEIRGFGSFGLNYRQPRKSRNPKTGEPVLVTGRWVPHFRPGKEMRKRVDGAPSPAPLRLAA